jgi:chromosome segregation protein
MRLKSIKLAGFKSFVDPTTVNLPGNLCAVVGPNGCGKSNIIDAVRWVMGEVSAKNLRGESMADVIFNGSGTRKPVAQATIELVFDNADGSLGGQYAAFAEISVKRRLSRDGQSVYYLNGTRCRRRDVTDVFLGTGLGPRSYAIIEQGMISRLIESRPEDLRVYLEEAAGISRYKERRRDTELRIQHTRENLERLADVRDELGRQLERLRRQATAAEKYRELKAEERRLQAEHGALAWRTLDAQARAREARIREQEIVLEALVAEREAAAAAIERLRASHGEASDRLNEAQRRCYAVGAEVSALEQRLQHGREQARRQRAELEQIDRNLDEARRHLEDDGGRATAWAAELAEVKAERARVAAELADAEQLQQADDARLQDSQRACEAAQAERADAQRHLDLLQARVLHLDGAIARVAERVQRQRSELAGLDEVQPAEAAAALAARLAAEEDAMAAQQAELDRLAAGMVAARARQAEIAAALSEERGLRQRLLGRRAGLTTLLDAARRTDAEAAACLDAWALAEAPRLADRLGVEPGWELAVETVLGDDLQARCAPALEPLGGRLHDLARGRLCLVERGAAAATGAGTASQLVDRLTAGRELASHLLAGVRAAEDFPSAWARRGELRGGESVVTREGIWFGANWVRAVRGRTGVGGELVQRRELAELDRELAAAEGRLAAQGERQAAAEAELRELEERRHGAERAFAAHQRNYAELRARQSAEAARRQQLAERRARLAREIAEGEALRQREIAELGAARAELQAGLDRLQAASESCAGYLRERDGCAEQAARSRDAGHRLRAALHQLELRERSLTAQLDSLREGTARLHGQIERLGARRAEVAGELAAAEAPAEELARALQERLAARVAAEADLAGERERVQVLDHDLRAADGRRAAAERRVQEQRDRLEQLRLDAREMRTRANAQLEQLQGLGVEPGAVLEALPDDAVAEAWQQRLADLDRRIQRLGPINLAALDECRQEEERKVYLDAQDAELRAALDTLEEAMRRIDRETRDRFKDTFDRVNGSLQVLFPKLFGGGRAALEMTGDDLLSTGIAIMAQPPGKRNATIHLLSGGEKALTAIALVFAIFELNPAPFCMLDEVDAPLDDINADRYARLVREMSEKVQFIFITHNKISMEIAGQLLGVTMHEPGVSRLVAVDVDEAVRLAEA